MEFADATSALTVRLAADTDDLAAAGAVYLAVEAWKHLSGSDAAWDRFGLEILDVRNRLYHDDEDVVVNATAPATDGPRIRHAVMTLVEQLAQHHDRRAADTDNGLKQRLDHDAAAQQLRRAAATLA